MKLVLFALLSTAAAWHLPVTPRVSNLQPAKAVGKGDIIKVKVHPVEVIVFVGPKK